MGLFRTAARASVAANVASNVHRRKQKKWAAEDQAAAAAAPPAEPQQAPDLLDQLTRLGQLRDSGVLTEDEFAAQKQRLLGP